MGAGDPQGTRYVIGEKLAREAERQHLRINLVPTQGSIEVISLLSQESLDIGLVQGGLPGRPEITQVMGLIFEPLRLLVKPHLFAAGIGGLKDKRLNLSRPGSGTRVLSGKVLDFIGLKEVEYKPDDMPYSQIMGSKSINDLPDAIFTVSLMPSTVAQFLISKFDYKLVELPYGKSLAIRDVWMNDVTIPPYTYGPRQDKGIQTIGTRMLLIARNNLPSEVIIRLLYTAYSPDFIQSSNLPLIETSNQESLPEYPLHPGVNIYKTRNSPLITYDFFMKLSHYNLFFLSLAIFIIILFVFFRFFRQKRFSAIRSVFNEVSHIEFEIGELRRDNLPNLQHNLQQIQDKLVIIRREATSRYLDHPLMPSLQTYMASVINSLN